MKSATFLPILLLSASCHAGTNGVARCAADLYQAVFERRAVGCAFDLTVQAMTGSSGIAARMAVEDASGSMLLIRELPEAVRTAITAGDRLHVRGTVDRGQRSLAPYANCRQIDILGHGPEPVPTNASVRSVLEGRHDCRLVRIVGKVRDVFRDEIDPGYLFLILRAEDDVIYLPFRATCTPADTLERLIGAEIAVCGVCVPRDIAARRTIGRLFYPADGIASVSVIRESGDPFDAPALADIPLGSPSEIARLERHRATGRTIAVWDRNRILIRTADGTVHGVTFVHETAPAYGTTVEVVGFPESDLYRINLARAVWRPSPESVPCDETPRTITVASFMSDERGRRCYDPYAHGRALRLKGEVVSLPSVGNDDGRLTLQNGDYLVPIDFSANPGALGKIEVGCTLDVTGTCIMESENWQPHSAFPRIRGFALVVRTPADVRILARPPWWTVRKLFAVIGSMLALLAAIVGWNLMLRRVAERRGRQLLRAQIAQTAAALKVEERTRLAVELHDAISQTLTGASMRIDAARKLLDHDREKTARQLDIASTTLDSCREELKNCIWDLRNEALDERDLNEAIRRTLARGIGEAKLTVRFNIPRARLSDNTTNAILCIIRELAVNAVRHGHATELRIAGSIEDANLLFSVRDNGSGFSADDAPGVAQGHFGLQGIRERLKRLNGSIVFTRPPEGGTKAIVRISNTFVHEETKSS